MDDFIIFVNAKAYKKATGKAAVTLANICEKYGVYLAVQHADLYRVSSQSQVTLFAQHIDSVEYGSHTGACLASTAKLAGASGTLLNHAEKQLSSDELAASIAAAKNADLQVVVCASSLAKAQDMDDFGADYIALELPELIGGDVSIVSADPKLISKAVSTLKTPVLVGAGVHSQEDVAAAKRLGARGVLLASAVAKKTDDPESVVASLVQGST